MKILHKRTVSCARNDSVCKYAAVWLYVPDMRRFSGSVYLSQWILHKNSEFKRDHYWHTPDEDVTEETLWQYRASSPDNRVFSSALILILFHISVSRNVSESMDEHSNRAHHTIGVWRKAEIEALADTTTNNRSPLMRVIWKMSLTYRRS